jgi:mRNA interferase MazF
MTHSKPASRFRRGDVILVVFPNSDLVSYKKRTALIVQADGVKTGLPNRVVACITSNLGRTGATRVPVQKSSQEGRAMRLQSDSVIVLDDLATIPEKAIDKVIGTCTGMTQVDAALRTTLHL